MRVFFGNLIEVKVGGDRRHIGNPAASGKTKPRPARLAPYGDLVETPCSIRPLGRTHGSTSATVETNP